MISYQIDLAFGKDYKCSGDERLYHCPFCERLNKKHTDRKLYVNQKSGKYICFRCGARGQVSSSCDVGDPVNSDMNSVISEFLEESLNIAEEDDKLFQIPEFLAADYPGSIPYNYLISRGISEDDMRFYSIRIFGEGSMKNRVIIPNRVYYSNYTDFYTGRAVGNLAFPKYSNSSGSHKNKIVFNIDNIKDGAEYLIINEGMINSIICGRDCSVALLGKSYSDIQLSQIMKKHPKKIYISLDFDAKDQIYRLARKLSKILHRDQSLYIVDLPEGQDASSLGKSLYYEKYFLNARKYETMLSYQFDKAISDFERSC